LGSNKINMDAEIEELSSDLEKERKRLEEKAQELKQREELVKDIEKEEVTLKVAGVDGGISRKNLQGIEIVITRACLVEMHYKNGKLQEHSYFPSPDPEPTINYYKPERETKKPQLHRMEKEIQTALNYLEKEPKINILLLDGSIVPNPSDKPKEDSKEKEKYLEVKDKYEKLFEKTTKQGIQLIGAIEDSRSRKISRKIGVKSLDNLLLHQALDQGQRTSEFNYSDEPGNHPVLSDFSTRNRNKVKAMYIKPSEEDTPLRLEYLEDHMSPDEIASHVESISRIAENYSYPVPLIEADLHAKLTDKQKDLIVQQIRNRAGETPSLREKRRDQRPFK